VSAPGGGPGSTGDGAEDPNEQRLLAYLEELREDPPTGDESLVRRVNRSARWQHAIRGPLEAIGHLTGAFADGIAALLGGSRQRDQ
jgi:hypothetical protein